MDNLPTDSVIENFVDNNGPIDTAFADEIYTETMGDNTQSMDHNFDTGVLIDANDYHIPELENLDEFNTNYFEILKDECVKNFLNEHTQGDSDSYLSVNDMLISHQNRPLTPYQRHEVSFEEKEE
jgi:hypothetical protein